ncbi:MAG: very short patch repair endonuclease [Bacteroidales bacterium]|nr:very short patch repair endonuclease [Bacteroidales bacterium]
MADKMTPEQRRRCMQSVHSKNTGPEMIVRRWLWKQGFRYRLHVKRLPGTPDIVLRRFHTVINVNGCFWHGHDDCRLYVQPKSNAAFWQQKIARNRERDAINRDRLRAMGWYSITIWECDLQGERQKATLQHLSLELSRILLRLNAPTPHPLPESPQQAAEPEVPYGRKPSSRE